ncbi:MAG: hypothetical protein ABIQ06_02685 [Caldimonas sp.]
MSRPSSPSDRTRRTACAALLALGAATLAGCNAFVPNKVELSQARLQELVARHFPVDRRVLDVIDLTLDSPRIGLQPETNRISVEVALRANGGGPIQTRLSGSLLLSQGLRFEPADRTIRLVDVRVERFVIDGLPSSWQRQLDRLGKPLARGLLEDQVLYTLRPKDVAGLEGRGLRPGDLRVTSSGVEITLVPVVR